MTKTKRKAKTQAKKNFTAQTARMAKNGEALQEAMKTAQTNYERALAASKDHMSKASTTMFRGYDEFASLSKENLDAMVASAQLSARGAEEIYAAMWSWAQSSLESTVSTAKGMMDCKNIQDVVDLQSSYMRHFMDNCMAEGQRLAEMSLQVTNEAIEPVKARANDTLQKILKPLAA
ncbi:MAG: phasin family protein [Dongiaceae bacterium]